MKKKLSIVLAVVLTLTLLLTSSIFAWTVVEDFEWGYDGLSLEYSEQYGSDVDWTVYTGGGSVAEIDNYRWHPGTGTRSARFYKHDTTVYSTVRAYYPLQEPSYISFYLYKDSLAYASCKNGNGYWTIDFRINSSEYIQYYSSGYHTLYSYKFPTYRWVHIEVTSINWDAGTYHIHVDGNHKVTATMRSGNIYRRNLWFGSWIGSGTFWIDDITDSEN